jgi:hypothetical protein
MSTNGQYWVSSDIRTLEKLRTQVIDDRRILFPLTRKQKDIYRAFDISPPA